MLPLWQPPQVSGYRSQVAWFRRCFPCARLEVQRGTETDVFPPADRGPDQTLSIRHLARRVIVREEGFLKGGLKRRVLAAVVYDERAPLFPEPGTDQQIHCLPRRKNP